MPAIQVLALGPNAANTINAEIDTPWELQGGVRHLQKLHQKSTNVCELQKTMNGRQQTPLASNDALACMWIGLLNSNAVILYRHAILHQLNTDN